MQYARVENGQVIQIGLPTVGILKDGSSVSGYNLLSEDVLKEEGWLPIEDNVPSYNSETQYIQNNGYIIGNDKVLVNYTIMDKPLVALDTIKQNKIQELWNSCNTEILNGFYSSCTGTEKFYTFSELDQANLTGYASMMAIDPTIPILWKDSSINICISYTVDEMKQLLKDSLIHKQTNIYKYEQLRNQVNDASSEEQINSIVW